MLTEDEKVRARIHLGYLNVQESATFILGTPAGVQTQFVIEAAFQRILPQAESRFRSRLDTLDNLLQQIEDNAENVEAEAIGEIKLRENAFELVLKRYEFFRREVANMLGIEPNPFDQRFAAWRGGAGGINVPVSG